jgi:hypothetical protein
LSFPCPKCNGELVFKRKRIKLRHPFGKSASSVKTKTGMREVQYCARCDKYFIVSLGVFETEVVTSAKKY